MTNKEYELHLLNNVSWWLCIRDAECSYCYHGDVFGVRTIIEYSDLEKIAEKHNVPTPGCIVGG